MGGVGQIDFPSAHGIGKCRWEGGSESSRARGGMRRSHRALCKSCLIPRLRDPRRVAQLLLTSACRQVLSFNKTFKDFTIEWTPSDPDREARLSIDARAKAAGLQQYILPSNGWALGDTGGTACGDGNSNRRQNADVHGSESADFAEHMDKFDLITCINMIHISPWSATLGLMDCAGKCLRKDGMLVCYGPFKVGGTASESNLRFDQSLRTRDPSWGVRNLEDVCAVAEENGLEFVEKIEMPANNLSVVFVRGSRYSRFRLSTNSRKRTFPL